MEISNAMELFKISASKRYWGDDEFILNFQDTNISDNLSLQVKINKLRNECGCTFGGVCSIIAVLGFGYVNFSSDITSIYSFLIKFFYTLMAMVASGLVGKVAGLLIAKVKLYYLYRSLIKS